MVFLCVVDLVECTRAHSSASTIQDCCKWIDCRRYELCEKVWSQDKLKAVCKSTFYEFGDVIFAAFKKALGGMKMSIDLK